MSGILPVFNTARLRLRGLEKGEEKFPVQLDTDPMVMRYIHEGVIDIKIAERCAFLEVDSYSNQHSQRRTGKWMVELPNRVTRIGWVEVSRQVVRDKEIRCVGYEFAPAFWGNGYASEAVCAVVSYVFESLNAPVVGAYTRPETHRSVRVLQKAGFGLGANALRMEHPNFATFTKSACLNGRKRKRLPSAFRARPTTAANYTRPVAGYPDQPPRKRLEHQQENKTVPLRPFWQIQDEICETDWKIQA